MTKDITINSLYSTVLREVESDSLQELPTDLYSQVSDFIGRLKLEEYDNTEDKIKTELVEMISDLISMLLRIRLEKALEESDNNSNLLDEEKYVLDSEEEMRERKEMILSGILNGRSKFLQSISQNHRTRLVTVRFIEDMDQVVGVDMQRYGPFKKEDIATLPYENAQALISKNVATKIRWEY